MALIFVDSFDHYATAQLARKWTSLVFGGPSIGSEGRNSTQGVHFSSSLALEKSMPSNLATVIVGGAFKLTSTGPFMRFMDTTTVHWHLRLETGGVLRAKRTDGTVLGNSANNVIADSATFYYIEVKTTIHNSTGAIEVRVNGAPVITLTGIDNASTANNYCNRVGVCGMDFDACSGRLDDLYIADTAGGVNDDFLGDVRVEAVYPDGAGTSTDFTPSAGSNYQCVDEALVNDDTDYVQSDVIGEIDLYTMGNISASASSVKAVVVNLMAKKTDVGARTARPLLRSAGTTNNGTIYAPTTAYTNQQHIFEGIVTDATAQNAMEAGVEVTG